MVSFENQNAERPYVIGSHYNGKSKSGYHTAGNDKKVIHTRSGTKIILNDADGSVFIEDPSGNTYLMDGQGNINVNAPKNMTFTAGENVNISAGMNVSVNAGMNITENAGINHNSFAGIMIHIGGWYYNGSKNKLGGSYGCFGFIPIDDIYSSPELAEKASENDDYDDESSNKEWKKIVNFIIKLSFETKKDLQVILNERDENEVYYPEKVLAE